MDDPARCLGTGAYLNPEETALRMTRTSATKANLCLELSFAAFTFILSRAHHYLLAVQLSVLGDSTVVADLAPGLS